LYSCTVEVDVPKHFIYHRTTTTDSWIGYRGHEEMHALSNTISSYALGEKFNSTSIED